jgi:hypothetical protein
MSAYGEYSEQDVAALIAHSQSLFIVPTSLEVRLSAGMVPSKCKREPIIPLAIRNFDLDPTVQMGQFYPSRRLSLSSGASNLDVNYISAEEDETSHVIPLVILQTHIQFCHTLSVQSPYVWECTRQWV